MQMTHPNSGTCNIKYINYTDSETKTQREDMEILPKDRTPAPEGGKEGKKILLKSVGEGFRSER